MLKIGHKVAFVKDGKRLKSGNDIPDFYTGRNGIPSEKLKHGSTILHQSYDKNFAKIVDTWNEFFIVEFVDDCNNRVRLGFKEESLELIKKGEVEMADAKVISIREDVLDVFKNSKDAKVVSENMTEADLGTPGFITSLSLEQNKDEILKEARKRKADKETKEYKIEWKSEDKK